MALNRRRFFRNALGLGASVGVNATAMTQPEAEGFFTLGERDGHWWLVTPDAAAFFTIGHLPTPACRL